MENNIEIVEVNTFKDNPGNPAKVYMNTGLVMINREAFYMLPDFARDFVIEHEKGHFLLQTFSENEADNFALNRLAYKEKNSLMNAIKSVRLIAKDDPKRVRAITLNVLRLEAENGNTEAKKLLGKIANAKGEKESNNSKIKIILLILFFIIIIYYLIKNK